MPVPRLTRRSLLRGFAVMAASGVAGFLVARGSTAAEDKPVMAAANDYGPAPRAADEKPLAALADLPPGGGLILADAGVVLLREGDKVSGRSATCTHQGCTVDRVADGVIRCPCHGSFFDAATGSVRSGPATRSLSEVAVVVRNGSVYRA